MFRRFANLRRIHFVGIGGAGMSGIAEVLSDYDLAVSGCDLTLGPVTERLESLGVEVFEGHSADHLEGVDLVVKSSAVAGDNPELVAARERNITVVRRAEMLGELMRLKYGIAVAGTHGKTTTTSLIGTVLTEAGLDPTVIVGGRLRVSGTGARLGHSDYLVAEADEYDRSFLRLQPIIAVVTSIDPDHLDTYLDLDEIRDAFVDFAGKVPFFGQIVLCLDDANIQRVLPELAEHRLVTYGLSPQADLTAVDLRTEDGGTRFTVEGAGGEPLGEVRLPMPGEHNVLNAWRRWRWGARWASSWRRSPPRWRGSRASIGASSGSATGAARRSSTTTPTTRPRWPPPCAPPARSFPAPGCSRSSSPICTAAPATSPRSSAAPCSAPTRRWSPTSTPRARRRWRASTPS